MMLRLLQNLRFGSHLKSPEVAAIATEIYGHCFAELAKETPQQSDAKLLQCFDAQPSNQMEASIAPTADDVWIFGYGSLVWKADFPYIDRRRGFVCGYKRRFYQHSIDHRGIPEKPGRVVTLLPGDASRDRVYGVAYRIASAQKSQVLGHLDYREKNGYERCILEFHEYPHTAAPRTPIEVIMYVATQANDSYAGNVWQVPCIARQIFTSAGPSGPNREYLFNLSIAMHQLFPDAIDEHLEELVDCVQRHIQSDEPTLLERALTREITSILTQALTDADVDAVADAPLQLEQIAERLEALHVACQRSGWRERFLNREMQQMQSS
ncbi:putative glutathione-specific gamma-glutamylcyclotransferase 2 isoform X2 [Drosophila grimshawi]|uniref:putative glutathione-specific gamma-glutamylcyclotransferase 2 isoform X2 n=1 Tax=Drosophila grimshawi TaxID=7222 RepID=UPI000C86F6C9|nr:putative glutathione-specific gamma-glutamylcyclotransferase 2 isoform X2 [Drosophila grimshawi]